MSPSVFYYCFCACLRRCRSFNPSLRRLSPFHLSYVAVSRPCYRRFSYVTHVLTELVLFNNVSP